MLESWTGGGAMKFVSRPGFYEPALLLSLALFSDTGTDLTAKGFGMAITGCLIRLWFFRDLRSFRNTSPTTQSWFWLRSPFEAGGLLILGGVGLGSGNLPLFVAVFLGTVILYSKNLRAHQLLQLSDRAEATVMKRSVMPVTLPAFPALSGADPDAREKLSGAFRSFYSLNPVRDTGVTILAFAVIIAKSSLLSPGL